MLRGSERFNSVSPLAEVCEALPGFDSDPSENQKPHRGLVAQLVEQCPFKALVRGSSPRQPTRFFMPWVYILRGSSGRHYIGSTSHLDRRLGEHQRGETDTTARLGYPLKLVASREVADLIMARKLEREMKRKKNAAIAIYLLTQP